MKRISHVILIAILFIGMIGCGDDSTGPNPDEAPSLPAVTNQEARPDLSYFENNQPKVVAKKEMMADTSNYYAARNIALTGSSFFAMHTFYSTFISAASTQEPSFEDGKWVWEYTYTYEGITGDWRLTAEEVSDGYKWALYLSATDSDGNSFEDYKVMEGTTAMDGSEGDWTFNSLNTDTNQEVKFFTTSWLITSDTEREWSFKFYENGTVSAQGGYVENKPEHTITLDFPDMDAAEIFWDTDTMTGYILQSGEKRCWDENFVNVSCS